MKQENIIGNKIRQAMKEAGLTQQKLADKLGITNPVVNVWVTGKRNPTIESLKKIAAATNKPYSYFIETDEFVQEVKAVPLTDKNTVRLPILADVPAGLPDYSDRDVEIFKDIPRDMFPGGADYVIRCIGDSLAPRFAKGDFCVVRNEIEPLHGRPMLVETENGRYVPMVADLYTALETAQKHAKSEYVIMVGSAESRGSKDFITTYYSHFTRKLPFKCYLHKLRHTFASHLVQNGADLYHVSKLMGHGSIKMTEIYAHLAPRAMADVIKLLPKI